MEIRLIRDDHRPWIIKTMTECWGSKKVVSRGQVHHADQLPGYITWSREKPVGSLTYHTEEPQCEIVSIISQKEGIGIGTAIIEAIKEYAILAGYRRIWLITTNDNTPALAFFQKRGF